MNDLITKILIESILITALLSVIGYFFFRREKVFEKKLQHKHDTLRELLGPIRMQLIRSKIALEHYKQDRHSFKEAILKECNETVRDTLLTKGHLIPSDLIDSAADFISHYDRWLQAYHMWRVETHDEDRAFVFIGGFPKEAEQKFSEKYEAYRKELKIEDSLN